MSLAPLILFVYNRPEHTFNTLEALSKNIDADKTDLFIFSDGPKNEQAIQKITEVRNVVSNVKGFNKVEIITAEKNKGLANSIIGGVTQIINTYGKVIVLEDDLISAPNFLVYMNKALNFYEDYEKVFTIHGYCADIKFPQNYKFDTYFVPTRIGSWGWGTWKNVWETIDWNINDRDTFFKDAVQQKEFNYMGNDLVKMLKKQLANEIDTWDVQFCYHLLKNNAYSIYPVASKIQNKGTGEVGTHNTYTNYFDVELTNVNQVNFNFAVKPDETMVKKLKSFLDYNDSKLNKISQQIRSYIKIKMGNK
ncbi:MAG: sugar transferase [Bacteroidota bacterium]|nr:sugar transferase [Bacteroidota bacterium]